MQDLMAGHELPETEFESILDKIQKRQDAGAAPYQAH